MRLQSKVEEDEHSVMFVGLIDVLDLAESSSLTVTDGMIVLVWRRLCELLRMDSNCEAWAKLLFCRFVPCADPVVHPWRKWAQAASPTCFGDFIIPEIMTQLINLLSQAGKAQVVQRHMKALTPLATSASSADGVDKDFVDDLLFFDRVANILDVDFEGVSGVYDQLQKVLRGEMQSRFTRALKLFATGVELAAGVAKANVSILKDARHTEEVTELDDMIMTGPLQIVDESPNDSRYAGFSQDTSAKLTQTHNHYKSLIEKVSPQFLRRYQSSFDRCGALFERVCQQMETATKSKGCEHMKLAFEFVAKVVRKNTLTGKDCVDVVRAVGNVSRFSIPAPPDVLGLDWVPAKVGDPLRTWLNQHRAKLHTLSDGLSVVVCHHNTDVDLASPKLLAALKDWAIPAKNCTLDSSVHVAWGNLRQALIVCVLRQLRHMALSKFSSSINFCSKAAAFVTAGGMSPKTTSGGVSPGNRLGDASPNADESSATGSGGGVSPAERDALFQKMLDTVTGRGSEQDQQAKKKSQASSTEDLPRQVRLLSNRAHDMSAACF